MARTTMGSLREVQALDDRMREADRVLATFDERLAEAEEPALRLESDLGKLKARIAQMRQDERRLERAADDKRARAGRLELRLNRVRNVREEAAVQTELDLIHRAIDGDEHEALHLLDQIRRSESNLRQLEASAAAARADVAPQQDSLRVQRAEFEERKVSFRARRELLLDQLGDAERRIYDAFIRAGQHVIVAALLDDGACGNCFWIIPLQLQNDIRRSGGLIRCEGCGVILTTEPEPDLDDELRSPVTIPAPEALEAASGSREPETGAGPPEAGR